MLIFDLREINPFCCTINKISVKTIKDVGAIETSYVTFGRNLRTTYLGVNPAILTLLYIAEFLTAGLHYGCYQ